MYFDEEPYYEPTIADEIMFEYQQKMKDALLESVKYEIEQIKEENIRLKKQNEEYKKRENNISSKESELKRKEENLKREVTNEFYKTNIGDTLKKYIEDCEVWFADIERYQNPKCDLCNEDRKLVAQYPNGKTSEANCDCAKMFSRYIPGSSFISVITFNKRDSRYSSDRNFYLSRTYIPGHNRSSYDYDYQEFKIHHVIDKFDETIIELHEKKSYSEKLGFRNKEECQKYCDWLNEKEKKSTIEAISK